MAAAAKWKLVSCEQPHILTVWSSRKRDAEQCFFTFGWFTSDGSVGGIEAREESLLIMEMILDAFETNLLCRRTPNIESSCDCKFPGSMWASRGQHYAQFLPLSLFASYQRVPPTGTPCKHERLNK